MVRINKVSGVDHKWLTPCSVILTLCLLSIGSAAIADEDFADGIPDGGDHTWCVDSGFNHEWRAGQTMLLIDAQTAVKSKKISCGDKTDVTWRQEAVKISTGRAYGMAQCKKFTNKKCDKYTITLDMETINAETRQTDQLKKTMCHELGHTLGLTHYRKSSYPGTDTKNSCLRSGSVDEISSTSKTWLTTYGKHHITKHINRYFGK